MDRAMSLHNCPNCRAQQTRRVKQQGFFQKMILRRVGYYPWECRFCKSRFLLKDRGLAPAAGRRSPEGTHSPVSAD